MRQVLIIEDDESLERVYGYELAHNGFEVEIAINGQDASDKIKERKPDFILSDIVLPDTDGIVFFTKLSENPDTANIPVGFISALGREIVDFNEEQRRVLEKGVFYMQKDKYTPQQIANEIIKYFASKGDKN